MLEVEHLEIHVAHACNLKCESCPHYSDQGHKGVVSLEQPERWMSAWSGRLRLNTLSLEGGDGNDLLDGGDGDDTLSGGGGNDTLVLQGLTFGGAHLTLGSFELTDGNPGDAIHLDNFDPDNVAAGAGIDTFVFGDGTVHRNALHAPKRKNYRFTLEPGYLDWRNQCTSFSMER